MSAQLMRLIPRTLKWRAILLTAIGFLAAGVVVYFLFGNTIRFWIGNRVKVNQLRDDPDLLVRSLARGEIHEGMGVEEFAERYPPETVVRHDRYAQLIYPSGVSVIAKDGRLASAVHTGRNVVFFTVLSDREVWGFVAGVLRDGLRDIRLRDEQSDWHRFDKDYAHSSVGGVAGYATTAGWLQERAGLKAAKEDER